MTLELMRFQGMEMNLTPTLKKVFSHRVKKQINALLGKLHLTIFTTIKLKSELLIKMLG